MSCCDNTLAKEIDTSYLFLYRGGVRQYLPLKKNFNLAVIAALALAALALILSALLVCKHSGLCTAAMGCSIDGVDGCASLAESQYSLFRLPWTTWTIPLAWLGFFYYSFVLFLLVLWAAKATEKKQGTVLTLLAGTVLFGFVFDGFLAYINFSKLITPCLLCAYTYLCQLGILIAVVWLYLSLSKQKKTDKAKTLIGSSKQLVRDMLPYLALPLSGALLLSLLLCTLFWLGKSKTDSTVTKKESNRQVLPPDQVQQVLREFRALKTVSTPTAGLRSFQDSDTSASPVIEIQEWLDFRCPHCRQASKMLRRVAKRWPGKVRIYYRYFPLDGTCNPYIKHKQAGAASCKAAKAAICTEQQDYFSKFVRGLFSFQINKTTITEQSLAGLVSSLGGSWPRTQQCMRSAKTRAALFRDLKKADEIKLKATPTLVINNHLLPSGVPQYAWLVRVSDALVLEGKEAKAAETK